MRSRPTALGVALAGGAALAVWATTASDPAAAGLAWVAVIVMLLVGLGWPLIAVATVRCRVEVPVRDLEVGDECTVRLAIRGGLPPVRIEVSGWDGPAVVHDGAAVVEARLVAARRGVHRVIELTAVSTAPFGAARARRVLRCPLDHAVHVGPRPAPAGRGARPVADVSHREVSRGASRRGDEVRSVRPYHPGDPSHLVHWASTARTGELMVRELEPPTELGLALVVDLGSGGDDHRDGPPGEPDEQIEAAVSRAAGRALAVMASGGLVVLCTGGTGGPVTREVGSRLDLSRRLAAAGPGPCGAPPEGWPVEVVRP